MIRLRPSQFDWRAVRDGSRSTARWRCAIAACCLSLVAAFTANAPLQAADSNAAFIQALRDRGWEDTALDYLGWVESSPLATAEFGKDLPYQRAVAAVAQARQTRNRAERERLLLDAAAEFEKFAEQDAETIGALDAMRQAANLYAEQALVTIAEARQLPNSSPQRNDLDSKARDLFAKATAAVKQVVDVTKQEIAGLPKAAEIQADPEAKARLGLLRDRQVEARFLLARLSFEEAATFEPDSPEFKQSLDSASKQFGQLIEEHRRTLVEASGRVYQGRCAQELGEYEKALGCFEEVIKSSDPNPEFRKWTARAVRHLTETQLKLDNVDDAVKQSESWLASSKPTERQQPEWLEVAYRLADAYQAKLKAGGLRESEEKRLQTNARNLLREISVHPNEFRQQAQLQLASAASRSDGSPPKTFEEALAAGKSAIDLWNSANVAAKGARESNPDAASELETQAARNRDAARRSLELAITLADAETSLEQLNAARYYLCYLYWEEKRLQDAAVMAEFLATRYPENEFAAGAAKIALAAYKALAVEAQAEQSAAGGQISYEAGKLAELAEFVATRWPESAEASSATATLMQTAVSENRLADAEAILQRLPEGNRGPAKLILGAALWTQYLRSTSANRDAPSDEAKALRDKGGALLGQGFDAIREQGDPAASSAVGVLYFVQVLLANGDTTRAIEVLENSKVGPLALIEAGNDVSKSPEFVLEAYKAALRAYLSTDVPEREKAERMMDALDKFAETAGGKKLTDVYLSLGVQLQRQLTELNSMGQAEKAKQVAAAFDDVLQRVSSRPDANDWRVREWIAQTNLQLGQGLSGDEARPYVEKARTAYVAMLQAADEDPKYAPSEGDKLRVRMRLAECEASLGNYEGAVAQYGEVLRQNPNMLDLQKGAATALQKWGVEKQDLSAFDRSIRGDLPQKDGKNLIWGWLRLANTAQAARNQLIRTSSVTEESRQRAARFEDLFYEARYNVAKSRFLAGKAAPAPAKAEHFDAAKKNIDQMAMLYADLGGPRWKPLFDELLKQINQELAKK